MGGPASGSDGVGEGDATAAGGGAAPTEGGGGHAAPTAGEQCGCGGHLGSPAEAAAAAAAAGVDALALPHGVAEEPRGAAAEAGAAAGRAHPPRVSSDGGMDLDAQSPAAPSAAPPAREAAAGAAADEAAGGGGDPAEAALAGLGFSRRSTRAALARFHGSAARAADWLLAGGAADAADAAPAGAADAGAGANGSNGAGAAPGEAALRARVEAALQRLVCLLPCPPLPRPLEPFTPALRRAALRGPARPCARRRLTARVGRWVGWRLTLRRRGWRWRPCGAC